MKRLITTSIFITLLTLLSVAQGGRYHKDYQKIKSEKISFITNAIELTPQEAEKFWPIYNEFETKKWDYMKERHELEKSLSQNLEELSDKEYLILSEKLASFPIRDGELNLEYNKKFLQIISPKKVVLLHLSEVNFRNTMLRKYRNKDSKNQDERQRSEKE